MANVFRREYIIDAFDGGLNNKYSPTIIEDSESPNCLNVVFDELGGVKTREGYSKVNTASVGSYVCDGLFTSYFNDGSSTMIAFWNGCAFDLQTTSFITIPSAQSVFASDCRVDMAQYQNICFFGSSGSTAYKYNGTEWTTHGIPQPASGCTVAADSAVGVLSGTYRYKIAFVNSYAAYGDLSTATSDFVVSLTKGYLTSIPVGATSYGVEARNIYRTYDIDTAVASSTYYYVTQIADNSTTVFLDNTADSSLGSEASNDVGVPPKYKFLKSFQERLFAVSDTDPMYLYYSDLTEPFTWPSTNFIKIGDGDGEKITGLGVQGNSLIVYKENSIWLIYMPDTTPSNWQRIKSDSKYGCASHHSIIDYDRYQLFLGQQNRKITGYYAFTGLGVDQDAVQLTVTNMYADAKSDRIDPEFSDFQDSYKHNACSIAYNDKLWCSVTKESSQTTNNYVYQFDYIRRERGRNSGSWVPFTGINASCFTVYDGDLYFGESTATGFVYQLNDGTYNDDGDAIDSYYWTKEYETQKGLEDWEKDFRYAYFIVETLGDWDMTISWRIDSDKGSGDTEAVNLNPGGSLWGTFIWGQDDWGGGVTRDNKKVELGQSVGKKIQFKFDNENTADQAFKVIRGNFYFNIRGLR